MIKIIEKDIVFFEESGGGVTFSGGEPLMQSAFLEEMLRICRNMGISTAVDTSCHAEPETVIRISELADLMLCDIKLIDEDDMLRSTGVSGKLILDNIRLLTDNGADVRLRMPVVPGVTDTEKNLAGTVSFIRSLENRPALELLPWHSNWMEKRRRFGLEPSLYSSYDVVKSHAGLIEYFTDAGIKAGG